MQKDSYVLNLLPKENPRKYVEVSKSQNIQASSKALLLKRCLCSKEQHRNKNQSNLLSIILPKTKNSDSRIISQESLNPKTH